MALELIDKQDTSEIVRDQIAAILKTETVNQEALATAAGKDPSLWALKVYTERSNPWERFLNQQADETPIVNVWYENASFDGARGNTVERQAASGTFNIDCYAIGVAHPDGAGGHNPGDREAAFAVQRAVRLARNILMAAENTYLQLRGTVWKRWPSAITIFQPQLDNQAAIEIVAARLALQVDYNEFSPQVQGQPLEYLALEVLRTEDGEIVLEADYDYTI